VTIGKLFGVFECRFVIRAADLGSAFSVFTQRVDAIIGHGRHSRCAAMPAGSSTMIGGHAREGKSSPRAEPPSHPVLIPMTNTAIRGRAS
jgi:hypothetical protein